MLVTLPIIFEVGGIPRGARSARLRHFVDRETFEIKECLEREAPVAIRSLGDVPDPGTFTRWYEGRHYALDGKDEMFDSESWAASLVETVSVSASWKKLMADKDRLHVLNDPDLATRTLDSMRTVERSTREEDRATAARMVDDLLLVEGKLFRAVTTPVYLLGGIWRRFVGQGFGVGDFRLASCINRPTEMFAMNRVDDMMAHAREYYPEMEHFDFAEVIIPETCRCDDEGMSLLLTAGVCVDMMHDWHNEMDERQGIAWYRLRSAVADGAPDMLEPTLREFSEACEATLVDNGGFVSDMEDSVAAAKRVLARWDVRPLEMDGAAGFSI